MFMTTCLKYVIRMSSRVGYFARLNSFIPAPLNEDVGQRKGKGDRSLGFNRPSCCAIQLWAETVPVKLRFTVKSSGVSYLHGQYSSEKRGPTIDLPPCMMAT